MKIKEYKDNRLNKPSSIYYHENGNIMCEYYIYKGKKHRENGPSFVYYDINSNILDCKYFLNDKAYTEQQYIIMLRKRKLKSLCK